MVEEYKDLLSSRILKHCMPLLDGRYFKHSAREAMVQVEKALKEKGMVDDNRYGQWLITSLFNTNGQNKKKNIRLRVPLGEDLQEKAQDYFKGVFSYYRNYTAHDGNKIDERICKRILIIASELLDLIDASHLSFVDFGGIDGLMELEAFSSETQIGDLLSFLETCYFPDGDASSLLENIWEKGFSEIQLDAIFDLDLIRYKETPYEPSDIEWEHVWKDSYVSPPETMGYFVITDLGTQTIDEIEKRVK